MTGLPQRYGSQDFGTIQSQLAIGQESILFIPPHPSTGQRNQFQFRGAIQAFSTAQIGQRGPEGGSKSGTDQGYASEA